MKDNSGIKNRWLHVRLSEQEYSLLHKQFLKTTERKISQYARNILLGNPMIAGHRNLTTETLITQFSTLVKTLNGLANNLNQSVHKLHTFDAVPEIKTWLSIHDRDKVKLFESMATLKEFMKENAAKWWL